MLLFFKQLGYKSGMRFLKTPFSAQSLFFLVVALVAAQAASAKYLNDSEIAEIANFLQAPPDEKSVAFARDFLYLHDLQDQRTDAECERAKIDAGQFMPVPFIAPEGPLKKTEADRWNAFSDALQKEIRPIVKTVKTHWQRPRPYVTDPTLIPCIDLENSFAYPSGHATMGELYAKILAEAYPWRGAKIMRRGRQYGFDRILGGVHHPSDVKAGRELADHIFEMLMNHREFREDLRKAKHGHFVPVAQESAH